MSTIVTCRLNQELLAGLDRYAAIHTRGSRSAALARLVRRQLGIPAEPRAGGQDRESGWAAAPFGREAAAFLARQGERCDLFEVPAALFASHARKASQGKYLQIDRSMIEGLELTARVYRRG